MAPRTRRLLSIGHSYGVALNRALPSEIARVPGWEVTVAAPRFFHGHLGDLRPVALEPGRHEACRVEAVAVRLSRRIHVMTYGRRLAELLREPWDLVHCWEEPFIVAGGQVAWLARPGVPLVYATFQNIAKRYPPPFNWIEKYALRRASGWIAFGDTIAQAIEAQPGYAERPHRVIPLGVDIVRFAPNHEAGARIRRDLGWTGAAPAVVGFLGRFVPEKGVELLTRVLDRLPNPWRALFVGTGELEAFLRQWGSGRPDRVRIVTGVPHDRVPEYLNAMDLLCLPSRTLPRWREQFGRALIEAFACGVPVVASNSGEIPHVVSDAGVLVAESVEDEWTQQVDRLLGDPGVRQALSARGLERARSVYAWPRIARRHVDFFEMMIALRGKGDLPA